MTGPVTRYLAPRTVVDLRHANDAVASSSKHVTVHELLEHASTDTYEAFETALDEYLSVLKESGNVEQAAAAFARAALRAQFAVVGALQKDP